MNADNFTRADAAECFPCCGQYSTVSTASNDRFSQSETVLTLRSPSRPKFGGLPTFSLLFEHYRTLTGGSSYANISGNERFTYIFRSEHYEKIKNNVRNVEFSPQAPDLQQVATPTIVRSLSNFEHYAAPFVHLQQLARTAFISVWNFTLKAALMR
jgi:hypothetical protein